MRRRSTPTNTQIPVGPVEFDLAHSEIGGGSNGGCRSTDGGPVTAENMLAETGYELSVQLPFASTTIATGPAGRSIVTSAGLGNARRNCLCVLRL